jgi:GWxTD domain-containing protein
MKTIRLLFLAASLAAVAGCAAGRKAVRNLPQADRDFLSEVRYIISKQERKVFYSLGPEERARFIEEFWKKRDPSPSTDENEFRDEYYRRIEYSNRVFREGTSGWTTDRGRAYILLGEPERRLTYPMGYNFYERPMEIWYYRYFTLLFIDYTFTGVYKLDTQSAQTLGVMTSTQMGLKPRVGAPQRVVFDFALRVDGSGAGEGTLLIEVPYERLNMLQEQGSPLIGTTLKIDARILDEGGAEVLRRQEDRPVSLQAGNLDAVGKALGIRLQLKLAPGRYSAQVTLENTADASQVSKTIKFKL